MVTFQIWKRIICVYQHFFILMQTEEQQQEGYFNNWVSKNIFMSAICQPFVLKNSLHFYSVLKVRTVFWIPLFLLAQNIGYIMQKTAAGTWILIILDRMRNESILFVDELIDYGLFNETYNDGHWNEFRTIMLKLGHCLELTKIVT